MPDSDGKAADARRPPAPPGAGDDPLGDPVRRIVHGINGALNILTLNIELLAAASAQGEESGKGGEQQVRSLASLRRAVRQIQEIVERDLLPLRRGDRPHS